MLLTTTTVEKPWGCAHLPAPFASQPGKSIGEIWFDPPPELDSLLAKYIFTSEKLSVQVHPCDDEAEASGRGRNGKEECWLVVAAERGATLGIGFDKDLSADEMRAAALDGSIEELMTWHEVQAGDFFYIPAGTVHAIGQGVTIIELQQNSDITYRLFDYGRPRELHLDEGIAVAKGTTYAESLRSSLPASGHASLVDGPYFQLDLVDGIADEGLLYSYTDPLLVLPLSGEVLVGGETVVAPGQCGLASDLASVAFAPTGKCLIARALG